MPANSIVDFRIEALVIPTYLPALPDKNPMFLEKRVYQGSSGKVYPLPFTDRIAETKTNRAWRAIWLENEFLRVLVLPELGGRIHALQDKTTGYDLIYRQEVIKPALVGLAGPWASGGIEFNWPQHHRPTTFMPVDFEIEEHADGAKTVWCSDHDPMARMKGMHGVCLRPGSACLEVRVRVHNRTPLRQTFLWWANVATRVHENYRSFFPPDVSHVADHAKRATSEYPLCFGRYYGVDYGERGRTGVPGDERPSNYVPRACGGSGVNSKANDLSFYSNIPVPTSYMCMGTREDFFGGYDYAAQAGIVHVANHHIAPGKKQWTWGNHRFGYAWDRNLTDADAQGECAPYIELMAGVYTDNQPDFSFLAPGETKSWSQFWYPIQKIGPAQKANELAAVHLAAEKGECRLGISVTRIFRRAKITLASRGQVLATFTRNLAPGAPVIEHVTFLKKISVTALVLAVCDANGRELISFAPSRPARSAPPAPATEPLAPAEIDSADELYINGLHLEQYRHATRCPTLYWREAVRRDPEDARCNDALGQWQLRRGEFVIAEAHFRRALARLTQRNPNPADAAPLYHLGLCLVYQTDACSGTQSEVRAEKIADAYAAFYKATWNQAFASAAYHALAEIDCRRGDWLTAHDHLDRALRGNSDNLRARNLKVIVLRRLGREDEAATVLAETLKVDRLDWWARHLLGNKLMCDAQTRLDLAHDYARAGFDGEAIALLEKPAVECATDLPTQSWGAAPLMHYTIGWLYERQGKVAAARAARAHGAAALPEYCFPARLEEIGILQSAIRAKPRDARAAYFLGNLFYDRRRHAEAIALWKSSAQIDSSYSVVWRNLGIGYFNILKKPARARVAYTHACNAAPADARLVFERDQLLKRMGESPIKRLRLLEKLPRLVAVRDDLTIEFCSLLNQAGRHADAIALLGSRKFQPWEGGEGQALGQHVRAHIGLGRAALALGDAVTAGEHFKAALGAPENLGEAQHLLSNQSDVHFWLGCACEATGEAAAARKHWTSAATFRGDFQEMSVRMYSEMTYYSALAWERLGQKPKAQKLLGGLLAHARTLARTPATIDYFATSLPTMLLFDDDLEFRQRTTALFLEAQARMGLAERARARRILGDVLRRDPHHAAAIDMLRSSPAL